jgi:hypothetical protein
MTGFTPDQINDRDTNITIGTAYLKLALDDFAAPCPGRRRLQRRPGRPRNWRNGPVLDAAIWAENVPFTETRDYVKKVLANTTNYAALITGQPQSLKARLGTVGPRGCGAGGEQGTALMVLGAAFEGGWPGCAPGGAVTFFCFAKRKSPKKRRPQSATLRREGANLRRGACGVRRGTHCAAAQLRSDNPGESVDEACALRRACPPRKRPPQAPEGV